MTTANSGQPASPADNSREASALRAPAFATISSHYYPFLVALFIGVMIISNITASKSVTLFPSLQLQFGPNAEPGLITDGAFYLFPLAYVLGDVISEVYGFKAMRRLVYAGFVILALASLCFWITQSLPSYQFYENQAAFEAVLGVVPRLVVAGLAGYLIGELLNSLVLVKMKERAGEKHLWARLLGSTVVGEFFDTVVFCAIAAGAIGITTWQGFANYTVVGFVWKCLVEIAVMPLTYAVVRWLKKREPTYQQALAEQKNS